MKRQLFYINSKNRNSGRHSNFGISINIDKNTRYDKVCLLSASIPKSFYLVRNGMNTFTLTENESNVIITLPVGNYNRESIRSVLQDLLNTNSPNGYNYEITYNKINLNHDDGKYLFTVNNNNDIQPEFTFATNLAEIIGFEKNKTYNFDNNILRTVNIPNLQPESTLFIKSDICSGINDNVLQHIYTQGNSNYSFIIFENMNVEYYSKPLRDMESGLFNFLLCDDEDNEIDTNGINILLTLMVYKSDENLSTMIKGYIKYKMLK